MRLPRDLFSLIKGEYPLVHAQREKLKTTRKCRSSKLPAIKNSFNVDNASFIFGD